MDNTARKLAMGELERLFIFLFILFYFFFFRVISNEILFFSPVTGKQRNQILKRDVILLTRKKKMLLM